MHEQVKSLGTERETKVFEKSVRTSLPRLKILTAIMLIATWVSFVGIILIAERSLDYVSFMLLAAFLGYLTVTSFALSQRHYAFMHATAEMFVCPVCGNHSIYTNRQGTVKCIHGCDTKKIVKYRVIRNLDILMRTNSFSKFLKSLAGQPLETAVDLVSKKYKLESRFGKMTKDNIAWNVIEDRLRRELEE